jgi:hypothetical protein
MMTRRAHIRLLRKIAVISLLVVHITFGAIINLEDFNSGANGWTGRDSLMSVSHDNGNGWMVGDFGFAFFPQTDAFRIDTGTDFIGDYVTPGITQIRFDLYAVNVLPSDLFIRLIDGANVFSYQFSPTQAAGIGFETFVVNLAWSYGWSGLSELAFNNALASVDAIEIQLARNGSSAHSFYLDQFETLDTDLGGGGGGPSAVPEPTTLSMIMLITIAVLSINRRKLFKRQS